MANASFNVLEGKYSASYRTDALIRHILSCTNGCFVTDLQCISNTSCSGSSPRPISWVCWRWWPLHQMNHFPVDIVLGQFLVVLQNAATIYEPLPRGLYANCRSDSALQVSHSHWRFKSGKVMVARVERLHRDLDQRDVAGRGIGAVRSGRCRIHAQQWPLKQPTLPTSPSSTLNVWTLNHHSCQ